MTLGTPYRSLRELLDHPEFLEGKAWRRAQYDVNEIVIVEGEYNNEIFVVLSGKVMVCTGVKISETREMLSGICQLFDGEEFAHTCFFGREPHSATVKTQTCCELAIIDAEKLKAFLDAHPDVGYQILYSWMQILLPRLRQANLRISNLFSWGLKAHKIDQEIKE